MFGLVRKRCVDEAERWWARLCRENGVLVDKLVRQNTEFCDRIVEQAREIERLKVTVENERGKASAAMTALLKASFRDSLRTTGREASK